MNHRSTPSFLYLGKRDIKSHVRSSATSSIEGSVVELLILYMWFENNRRPSTSFPTKVSIVYRITCRTGILRRKYAERKKERERNEKSPTQINRRQSLYKHSKNYRSLHWWWPLDPGTFSVSTKSSSVILKKDGINYCAVVVVVVCMYHTYSLSLLVVFLSCSFRKHFLLDAQKGQGFNSFLLVRKQLFADVIKKGLISKMT